MKTVAITGASSGIGRASALLCARNDFQVFASVRKVEDAESLQREGGERITPVLMDVTDQASIAAAAGQIDRALDGRGLHGLVNNAGIGLAAPLEYVPLGDVRHVFEVSGVLNASKAALGALNDSLRLELAASGVDVVLIEPAAIATPAVEKTRRGAAHVHAKRA